MSNNNTVFTQDSSQGIIAALCAFCVWGLLPLYWKALGAVPPYEQISHRIVWSVVALFFLIIFTKRIGFTCKLLTNFKLMIRLSLSSLMISVNWYIYIWAVSQNRVMDSSLGYYITPLVSTLFGYVVLKERFDRLQGIGILCAVIGVGWNVLAYGSLPVLALSMAVTFSLYGLIRKLTPVDPVCGLFVETLLMLPFALLFLSYSYEQGSPLPDISLLLLLMCAGPFTLIPLILFNYATQRVRLMIVGMAQYVSPTISFFLSIFVFKEPFNINTSFTFIFIWIGLIIFTWASWRIAHPRHAKN